MSFVFRYKPVRLKSNKVIHRPLIPFTIFAKEKISLFGVLDSGSDLTIIPKEIVQVLEIPLKGENEISGIGRDVVNAREGKVKIEFGKGREVYRFEIPILVPEIENVPIIIGRVGFFNEFRISFLECLKRVEFKKI